MNKTTISNRFALMLRSVLLWYVLGHAHVPFIVSTYWRYWSMIRETRASTIPSGVGAGRHVSGRNSTTSVLKNRIHKRVQAKILTGRATGSEPHRQRPLSTPQPRHDFYHLRRILGKPIPAIFLAEGRISKLLEHFVEHKVEGGVLSGSDSGRGLDHAA